MTVKKVLARAEGLGLFLISRASLKEHIRNKQHQTRGARMISYVPSSPMIPDVLPWTFDPRVSFLIQHMNNKLSVLFSASDSFLSHSFLFRLGRGE